MINAFLLIMIFYNYSLKFQNQSPNQISKISSIMSLALFFRRPTRNTTHILMSSSSTTVSNVWIRKDSIWLIFPITSVVILYSCINTRNHSIAEEGHSHLPSSGNVIEFWHWISTSVSSVRKKLLRFWFDQRCWNNSDQKYSDQ